MSTATITAETKLTATIVAEGGKGCWFAEQDVTHESVFVHQRQVVRGRYLHIGDRIRFSLAPNPSKPDKIWAVDVEFIGIQIARQVSSHLTGERR